jgi:alkylation response protein AidB-like acyl-CoA dehydrogenase
MDHPGHWWGVEEPDFAGWWQRHGTDPVRTENVPALVAQARADGILDVPLPGHGQTRQRWAALSAWGRADLVFARLAEGHCDAVAILAELSGPAPGDALWGVWAAAPRSVTARQAGPGWLLDGDRPWCSGAGVCERALVTAEVDGQIRLFAVSIADAQPLEDTWPAVGMAGSDSRTVRFTATPARPVGEPGQYVDRPGFWHGGMGVAACWYGGALGVADVLLRAARERDPDPHALAHLGAVSVAVASCGALLEQAAAQVDADPKRQRPVLAAQVRLAAEATASQAMDRVGRALGAGPLCLDHAHARRVADLTVYLRQSHAEADLARLGEAVREGEQPW